MIRRNRLAGRNAGFSFIELLVTIVIAAIAFAAMVPVFVTASQKNSADNMRVQSTLVAQDKLEKVRQLGYGTIKSSNLVSKTFADAQFGPEQKLTTGSGERIIKLTYSVTPYPATPTGLQSEYKVVTVTASWDAPPAPVKPATLSTIVYRQYAGPPIAWMKLIPSLNTQGVLDEPLLASVLLEARVDLSAGSPPSYLQFAVSGPASASQKVNVITDTTVNSTYWYDPVTGSFFWRWSAGSAPNGNYTFSAVAFTSEGFVGNTFYLYPIMDHAVLPAAPAGLTALPGNNKVNLSWNASSESTTSGYLLFRSTDPAGPWEPGDLTTQIKSVTANTLTYTDPDAVNGTTYYYAVRTVTSSGGVSDYTLSNAVKPSASSDGTAPTAVSNLTATAVTGAPSVQLQWTAATDPGSPSTGVKLYEIWRSANSNFAGASAIGQLTNLTPPLTYVDSTAGYLAEWYYEVCAVDGALNAGPFATFGPVTTGPHLKHDLTISVKNGEGNNCNVWVLYATSGETYSQDFFDTSGIDLGKAGSGLAPGIGTSIAKNGSVTFKNLPDGNYTVYSNSGGFDVLTNKTWSATVSVTPSPLTGVTP